MVNCRAVLKFATSSISSSSQDFKQFHYLFQTGVLIRARVGCSLGSLLRDEWHMDPDYVASRITTIFIDGRAIDDIDSALVTEGSTVALSGAMPGLVGATMRRGGHLAAMRANMTYLDTFSESVEHYGLIRLKLFNLLLHDLVPFFLRFGIMLSVAQAADLLRSGHFKADEVSLVMEDEEFTPDLIKNGFSLPVGDYLRVVVSVEECL